MKKILLGFTLLFFVLNTFCQVKTNTVSREAYFLKSKKQKKAGIILLTAGVACIATAFIIPRGDYEGVIFPFYEEYENDNIKAAFGMAGIVTALGSIPFFITSNKNKKRAMKTTVSIENKKIDYLLNNSFVVRTQPSFTLRIGL